MKTLHLITIVILCLALLSSSMVFVTMPQRAYASDCGIKETTLTIPQFYRVSDAVFVGTISSIQSYTNHQWMVKFDAEKIWKGPPSPKITIITGNIAACGYSLVQGEKYLIFANGSPLDYISWFSRPFADAQADIAIFDDPQFQAQEKYKEELNKKLEAAKDAISNLMGSRMGDIPFNMVGVDVINSTLDVGIDSTKATLSEEAYLKKIKEIVGDIPIKITFGQIVADVGDSSNNIPRKDLPSPLISPLKQLKSGISASNVTCRADLAHIIKAEDGSPACVKPDSIAKLVERGWAVPHIMNFGYNPGRGPATLEQRGTSTSINQQIEQVTPSCVSNIPHQYAIAGPPGFPLCPVMNFQAFAKILNASGFYGIYNYSKYPGTANFVLEPGHNGTITYLVSMGMIREFGDTLQYSDKINITNGVSFMHDAGMNNHPGIDLAVEPKSETMQSNSTALVTITFLASKDASLGTYWVTLPPGIYVREER